MDSTNSSNSSQINQDVTSTAYRKPQNNASVTASQTKCQESLYQSLLPYPKVQAECKNRNYALAMLDNIGGSNSEMSAISLYFYDSLVSQEYPEMANTFHQISMVEMHHLDIFGTLALQLGADPRLWTLNRGRQVYWSPAYNQYSRDIHDILADLIQGEKGAIEKYSNQAKTINDPNVVANLNRIILDEEVHVKTLTMFYDKLC